VKKKTVTVVKDASRNEAAAEKSSSAFVSTEVGRGPPTDLGIQGYRDIGIRDLGALGYRDIGI